MMTTKMVLMWVLGALSMLFGAMLAGNADPAVLGATPTTFYLSLGISFILFLIAGFLWVTVSGAIRENLG